MKKHIIVFVFLMLIAGCGSKPIPDWTNAAFNQLENFRKNYLAGKTQIAEIHFNKAVEEIKKSGDLDILARAYLTKCAVQTAVLEKMDDREYLRIDAVQPVPQNRSFHKFLGGDTAHVEEKLLPVQYQGFFMAYRSDRFADISGEISKMEDPLSKLIAAGFLVKQDKCDEGCLKIAVDTASKNGWKKALLVYLEKSLSFYEMQKDMEKATTVRKKIELIKN
ncbi:MAG: hypothetical protein NTZ24_05585 [Deltaproteobacteria bacterium]|nr:hypothetical protein [Deltaproteobacteria bacterium]